jgi:hypothetical protein
LERAQLPESMGPLLASKEAIMRRRTFISLVVGSAATQGHGRTRSGAAAPSGGGVSSPGGASGATTGTTGRAPVAPATGANAAPAR